MISFHIFALPGFLEQFFSSDLILYFFPAWVFRLVYAQSVGGLVQLGVLEGTLDLKIWSNVRMVTMPMMVDDDGDGPGGGDNDAEYQLFILLTPIGFHVAQAESACVRLNKLNLLSRSLS